MTTLKKIRTAGDTNPRHGHIVAFNLQMVQNPRQLMHFEATRGGRILGYRTFETLGTYPQTNQVRGKSPVVYAMYCTDNKWNTNRPDDWGVTNPVGDSNNAMFTMANMSEARLEEEYGVKSVPFNSWEVTGQLSEDHIPTKLFDQAAHLEAMRQIGNKLRAVNAMDVNDPKRVAEVNAALEMQNKHFADMLASGQIDRSGVIYVNQNGLRPSLTIYQEQRLTGVLSQDLFTNEVNKITYAPTTNLFSGYLQVDVGQQFDPELGQAGGEQVLYGMRVMGGNRNGIQHEARVYDGQGNDVRAKIILVNAMPVGTEGQTDRAEVLSRVLHETSDRLFISGNSFVRFNKRNSNSDSDAVVFSVNIDEYQVMSAGNVAKRVAVNLDEFDMSAIDVGSSDGLVDTHIGDVEATKAPVAETETLAQDQF